MNKKTKEYCKRLESEWDRRLHAEEFINPRYLINIGYNSIEIQRCLREGEWVHPDYLEPLRRGAVLPDAINITESVREEEVKALALINRLEVYLPAIASGARDGVLSGEAAYDLHQSKGFSLDLLEVMLESFDIKVDLEGYYVARERHRHSSSNKHFSGEIFEGSS